MNEPADKDSGAPEPEGGILGNLPRSRPSVRSPRRTAPEAKAAEEAPEARAEQRVAPPPAPVSEEQTGNELEQLARAGVTLASGVAAVGLKVAGRAASTLRETIERR